MPRVVKFNPCRNATCEFSAKTKSKERRTDTKKKRDLIGHMETSSLLFGIRIVPRRLNENNPYLLPTENYYLQDLFLALFPLPGFFSLQRMSYYSQQQAPVGAPPEHRLNQTPVTSKIKSVITRAVTLVVGCFTVMLPVRTGEDDRQRAVEPIEPAMLQVSNEVGESTAPDLRLEQSPVTSNSTLTVALAFAGASFAAMYNVPGGWNQLGRAAMCETISFNVFLIADMLAFHASFAVCVIVATESAKMDYLIRITLWAAAMCFPLAFHATAYVIVVPNHKWIVLCFGCAVTIVLALLLLYRLSTIFYSVIKAIWYGSLGSFFNGRHGMITCMGRNIV
ncbi:hypothetical protein SUGI_0382040 [Cryptomeria japonica]|nr:hypothetical protein SUGI_0382040 [Cryptomeria japonica]